MAWSQRPLAQLLTRLAVTAFGLALGVAALDGLLRVGAGFVPLEPGAIRSWDGAAPRVLCLGDSNTYGIYLAQRADAYPQQVEQALAQRGLRADVINLGYPGNNSSRIRASLQSALTSTQPDTVMLMAGANDFWTVPEPLPGGGESPSLS